VKRPAPWPSEGKGSETATIDPESNGTGHGGNVAGSESEALAGDGEGASSRGDRGRASGDAAGGDDDEG